MCIYVQDIKFLWSNLWTGGLSTDDNNNDDNANDDANDDTQRTIHDCIGSSAISKWANDGSLAQGSEICVLLCQKQEWQGIHSTNIAAIISFNPISFNPTFTEVTKYESIIRRRIELT